MEAPNRVDIEKGEMRVKLENAIEKAKEVCERLQDQTAAAAKATDKTIREHPYQALGIAFGTGVLIGVLVTLSRRD
ncbi:MAG TPA: DUF883 C-terminal domain-containing protein [Verrucomicrobiae bacterium]|nr:DUF883 C-terminal domain-containing protein [Verrucomicrobiae bacterium]